MDGAFSEDKGPAERIRCFLSERGDRLMELNIAPGLSQKLDHVQQQSLALLTLPLPELQEYIAQQIRDYPLLEVRGQRPESLTALSEDAEAVSALEDNTDWFWQDRQTCGQSADPLMFLRRPQTFTEDLLFQLAALKLSPLLHKCCVYIIYSLSPRGYLLDSEEELARQTGVPMETIRQAIYAVQSLTPAGVGAHDLSECLILQLAESQYFNSCTVRIVKDHLGDLAAGRYGRIAAALGISKKEAEHWCAQIRQLNPIPSKGYAAGGLVAPVIPEAAVAKNLAIIMNQAAVPEVVMPDEYQAMLEQPCDASVRDFLQKNQGQAKLLTGQLERRQRTLLSIITWVVRLQPDYFQKGPSCLQPMTMQQIAERLSLNVSTVSRAVSGKYIDTPWGTAALRSLFAGAPSRESTSSAGIKYRIKELIGREDRSAPLSDGELCTLLAEEQIMVSRRTVAKYRSELHILPASLRRGVQDGGTAASNRRV